MEGSCGRKEGRGGRGGEGEEVEGGGGRVEGGWEGEGMCELHHLTTHGKCCAGRNFKYLC